jgi:hypothetical protein
MAARRATSVTKSFIARRLTRVEEPAALAAHAGICAGGEEKSSSLPRSYGSRDPLASPRSDVMSDEDRKQEWREKGELRHSKVHRKSWLK